MIVSSSGNINYDKFYEDGRKLTKIIDVNEKGQLVSSIKQEAMTSITLGKVKVEITDEITIEDGIEMKKMRRKNTFATSYGGLVDGGTTEQIIERNPEDLVTARIILREKGDLGRIKDEVEGQILLSGDVDKLLTWEAIPKDLSSIKKDREEGKTHEGFMYEGNNRRIKREENQKKKELFDRWGGVSDQFRKFRYKKSFDKR